jgi:transcription elongation factor GreA
MFSYLSSFLKTSSQAGEQAVTSYLLIKELVVKYPHLGANLTLNFADIFNEIDDVGLIFHNIKDSRFKEEFLKHIKMFIPNWADIYVQLFPRTIITSIISQLEHEGYAEKLTAMTLECFESFRDRREAVVWLYKNAAVTDWFKAANISTERQIIVLIHILDLTYRDIENQRDTAEARKINKQVYTILFKDGVLKSFIDDADTDTISRIYTFINDIKNLDPQDKMNLRSGIKGRYADFKFPDEVTETKVSHGHTVTKIKFGEKQKELANIMDVKIPANSKDIETARLQGDLKENADYIEARKEQVILNTTAANLKEEIERAQIFDPATIDASRVSFGTVVVLHNDGKNRKEEYTILGPWESDPDNNVISYQTPFGRAMMGMKQGEQFSFAIDGETNLYTVEQIGAANI